MKTKIHVVVMLIVSLLSFAKSPLVSGTPKLTSTVTEGAVDSRGGPGVPCGPIPPCQAN